MEITNPQKCIVMRNGIEIWIEAEKFDALTNLLTGEKKIIKYDGRLINSVDIIGIFTPEDMENYTRRKNGQWQCSYGKWHNKGEDCFCSRPNPYESKQIDYDNPTEEQREARAKKLDEIRQQYFVNRNTL